MIAMEQIADAVTVCALITSIATIVNIITIVVTKLREPEKNQNDRISDLENRLDKVERHLENDNMRLEEIEEDNSVTHQALFALLSHAINGNDIDSLKNARKELETYLSKKKVSVNHG